MNRNSGMPELFNEIIEIEGIKGILLVSFGGDLIFKKLKHAAPEKIESWDLSLFIESLAGMRETDILFKKGRLYIRKTDIGYLVVVMGLFVPIAMIRLQCDILLPSLKPVKPGKVIRRLFKG